MSQSDPRIKKMQPKCPECGVEMRTAGHLRTERKIKTIFQCMNPACDNHISYTRKSARLGGGTS